MTQAVTPALNYGQRGKEDALPLAEQLRTLMDAAIKPSDRFGPGMTKDEIDAMWGQ